MSEQQKMYKHVVSGEAIVGTKIKENKPYQAEFVLPLIGGEALSAIQNKLIVPHLKEKMANFSRVRICKIISTTEVKDAKVKPLKAADVPKMNLEELQRFSAEQNLRTDISRILSADAAREAVQKDLKALKEAAKKAALKGKGAGKGSPKKAVDVSIDDDGNEFVDEE